MYKPGFIFFEEFKKQIEISFPKKKTNNCQNDAFDAEAKTESIISVLLTLNVGNDLVF